MPTHGRMVFGAPWSAAEWAGALRFVELLQAQPGRHGAYYTTNLQKCSPDDRQKKRQRRFEIFYSVFLCLHKEINASRFSGPEPLRTIFRRRALDLSFVLKPRFFNAFFSAFFSALNFFQCIFQCIFQWKNVLPSNWISSVQK